MEKPKEQCSSSLVKEVSSHPLFSILTTFSLLILLYIPNLLPLLLSPIVISTSLLLTTLLHLGSSDSLVNHRKVPSEDQPSEVELEDPIEVIEPGDNMHYVECEQKMNSCESLVEWGWRGGPLEVIYEDFEGEEDEDDNDDEEAYNSPQRRLDFMRFYDTDGDSDSSCSSTENMRFLWEEEEGDGMIEIALEEDNLIEIDLRTCR